MNFIQFALNNVKRNTKSYLGYFFSILISSTLLFSFRMFINHPDLDTSLFPNYIIAAMQVTEVIIYLFLSLFVFYSASVFLKSRNKDFGILYTIGAVLYGLGKKKKWIHSVFHIFVVVGSLLHFLAIYLYALI